MSRYDLRRPVGVFLVVFGLTRIAELLDWSRMHADAVSSLAMGGATVTTLIIVGKAVDLLLTAAAVLALVRGHGVWLLVALAGWTAGFAVLTVLAGIGGDAGALVQQGCFFVVFAGLLAGAYLVGLGRAPSSGLRWPSRRTVSAEPTRQDLPVQGGGVTRQDLPVHKSDVTRQDMPVHQKRVAPKEKPVEEPAGDD